MSRRLKRGSGRDDRARGRGENPTGLRGRSRAPGNFLFPVGTSSERLGSWGRPGSSGPDRKRSALRLRPKGFSRSNGRIEDARWAALKSFASETEACPGGVVTYTQPRAPGQGSGPLALLPRCDSPSAVQTFSIRLDWRPATRDSRAPTANAPCRGASRRTRAAAKSLVPLRKIVCRLGSGR